jgi:hypothetical protein
MYKNIQQGFYKPINPKKYKGDANNIFYRSGWECRFMRFLDTHPDVLHWASEELFIKYLSPIDKKWHRYFPDFLITRKDKEGVVETILVEIKPEAQKKPPVKKKRITKKFVKESITYSINKAKWEFAEQWCKKQGIKFMVLTEKDLF